MDRKMKRKRHDKETLTWCSDALHDILGFADTSLAMFLVSVANDSLSPNSVLQVLEEGGCTASFEKRQQFANRLVNRMVESGKQSESLKPASKVTNAQLLKSAAGYALLDDNSDQHDSGSTNKLISKVSSNSKVKKENHESNDFSKRRKDEKRSRKRRYREYKDDTSSSDSSNSSSEDDLPKDPLPTSQRRKRGESEKPLPERVGSPESEGSAGSNALKEQSKVENDKQERDELVTRMLKRDMDMASSKFKKVADEKQHKHLDLERKLLNGETVIDELTGTSMNIDKLREESRRVYLKKREERELELLKQSIRDEEDLFKDEKLTEHEKKRIEIGKKILSMASSRNDEANRHDGFYRLPDEINQMDSKSNRDITSLTSRYVEPTHEKTEGELWEESQIQKGASKLPKNKMSDDKQYDLIFDDGIDFVMQETTKGYDLRETKKSQPNEVVASRIPTSKSKHELILEGRKRLPVYAYRNEFLAALKDNQVLILVGETGSGKTTQIPQYLHEIGYSELGKIGCTQPRRVAAMSVAARVAEEMDVRLGHEVGYSIRFENCTNSKTVIQYMTDGMLLREILTQPDLTPYSCMIIDEAHERTLHTDILFGLVKDIVRFRPDLKLVISSATLDAEKFSKYFDDASIFLIPGRMFPVDIYYTKAPEADYVEASIVTVLQIHVSQPLNGDILVFLTGQEEIETAAEILAHRAKAFGSRIAEIIICPIYANLPSDQQSKIFDKTPSGARKVVIATNIAETSLTIDGICYVVDTGLNKQKTFNARSGMESLVVVPVSQAAANQRAGRAGRTQPGKCFRLYTAFSFQHELEPNTVPEILRTNLGNVVLLLKSLGINDLISFDFLDKPPADALIRALEQLYALSALSDTGELTKIGRRMAEFPLDPMLSKTVIVSEKYRCTSEILSVVSMLSLGASVFYRPKEKAVHADTARLNFARGGGGDHISLLRCYADWAANEYSHVWCFENYVQVRSMKKARDIREQLESFCDRVEVDHLVSSPDDLDSILKAVTAGFFYNVAKLSRSGEYQTIKQAKTVYIHPSSVLAKDEDRPNWVVYFELAFTTKEYMRQVAPIQPSWLIEIAPHYYQENEVEDVKTKKMPKSRK